MEYPEPFVATLQEGPIAANGDLRQFFNNNDFVVRVEQDNSQDYARYSEVLRQFEEISGLNVVPYWDVIGETEPPKDLVGVKYYDNSRFRAVFHIAKNVTNELAGHNISQLDFSPEVTKTLIEGLTDYFITVYENKSPYSYEIRPNQFMYGKVVGDDTPKLYMVDVDYALSEESSVGDLMWNLGFIVDFLLDYQRHPALRPVAERLLEYIRNSKEIAKYREETPSNRDTFDYLETDLLDYIDAVDHL